MRVIMRVPQRAKLPRVSSHPPHRGRSLRFEYLEGRQLLSGSPLQGLLAYSDGLGSARAVESGVNVAPAAAANTLLEVRSSPSHGTNYGEAVVLTAYLTSVGGVPTGTVQFVVDDKDFGAPVPLTAGTAGMTVNTLAIGSHQVTAKYFSDAPSLFADSQTLVPLTVWVSTATTTTKLACDPKAPT